MTPLERAARAMAGFNHRWEALDDDGRATYYERVRAVIQAIREPSEAMVMRGLGEWQSATDFGGLDTEASDIVLTHRAMIDALLAEEG